MSRPGATSCLEAVAEGKATTARPFSATYSVASPSQQSDEGFPTFATRRTQRSSELQPAVTSWLDKAKTPAGPLLGRPAKKRPEEVMAMPSKVKS